MYPDPLTLLCSSSGFRAIQAAFFSATSVQVSTNVCALLAVCRSTLSLARAEKILPYLITKPRTFILVRSQFSRAFQARRQIPESLHHWPLGSAALAHNPRLGQAFGRTAPRVSESTHPRYTIRSYQPVVFHIAIRTGGLCSAFARRFKSETVVFENVASRSHHMLCI